MKSIVLLVLLLPTLLFAQKKQSGYLSFKGGLTSMKNDARFTAGISAGMLSNKTFAIGMGIGYLGYSRPYLPITLDMTFFGIPNKVSPIILGQIGYGVYNYSTQYASVSGGIVASINGGISFPAPGGKRVFIMVGYGSYRFTTRTNVMTGYNDKKTVTDDKRVNFCLGIKI